MDDPMATVVAIEEQVSALSGFSMELTEEDLQKWTKSYKEDKCHVTMYQSYTNIENMEIFI